MPSVAAIAEFSTITSNASGDFGIGSGGTISMTIKSGTRDFHGEATSSSATMPWMPITSSPKLLATRAGVALQHLRLESGRAGVHSEIYNTAPQENVFFWNQEWRKFVVGTPIHCRRRAASRA